MSKYGDHHYSEISF